MAIKPCGCVVTAIIPAFCSNRDIGHRLGPCLRRGWTIERMRMSEARDALTKCLHVDDPKIHQVDLFARGPR